MEETVVGKARSRIGGYKFRPFPHAYRSAVTIGRLSRDIVGKGREYLDLVA
jgi:hypothetical protein